MKKKIISPSLLAANFGKLDDEISMLNKSNADWVHLDVMDGCFVPNISFGLPVVQHIAKQSTKLIDVHLMIVQPERYLKAFSDAGAQMLTVHAEACIHLHRVIEEIKSLGMMAGVALNPHTPVHLLEDVIADLDLLLVMSVNPGFGGQKFIPHSINKISTARELITKHQSSCLIQVDGGINITNAPLLYEAGADVLVVGSALFSADDPLKYIDLIIN